jgi:hypothetical protein
LLVGAALGGHGVPLRQGCEGVGSPDTAEAGLNQNPALNGNIKLQYDVIYSIKLTYLYVERFNPQQ